MLNWQGVLSRETASLVRRELEAWKDEQALTAALERASPSPPRPLPLTDLVPEVLEVERSRSQAVLEVDEETETDGVSEAEQLAYKMDITDGTAEADRFAYEKDLADAEGAADEAHKMAYAMHLAEQMHLAEEKEAHEMAEEMHFTEEMAEEMAYAMHLAEEKDAQAYRMHLAEEMHFTEEKEGKDLADRLAYERDLADAEGAADEARKNANAAKPKPTRTPATPLSRREMDDEHDGWGAWSSAGKKRPRPPSSPPPPGLLDQAPPPLRATMHPSASASACVDDDRAAWSRAMPKAMPRPGPSKTPRLWPPTLPPGV